MTEIKINKQFHTVFLNTKTWERITLAAPVRAEYYSFLSSLDD